MSFDLNHTIGDPDVSPIVTAAGVSGATGTSSQSLSLAVPEVSPGAHLNPPTRWTLSRGRRPQNGSSPSPASAPSPRLSTRPFVPTPTTSVASGPHFCPLPLPWPGPERVHILVATPRRRRRRVPTSREPFISTTSPSTASFRAATCCPMPMRLPPCPTPTTVVAPGGPIASLRASAGRPRQLPPAAHRRRR